jgi:hypothetical protein
MSIRKRRLLNKRIKPKTYIFSYWFKRQEDDTWQQHIEKFSSRLTPFNRCVIKITNNTSYLYPKLERND